MRVGLGAFPALQHLAFMDQAGEHSAPHTHGHIRERIHAEGVAGGEREGAGGSARPGWEEAGDQYLEKLESLAESAVRYVSCTCPLHPTIC